MKITPKDFEDGGWLWIKYKSHVACNRYLAKWEIANLTYSEKNNTWELARAGFYSCLVTVINEDFELYDGEKNLLYITGPKVV